MIGTRRARVLLRWGVMVGTAAILLVSLAARAEPARPEKQPTAAERRAIEELVYASGPYPRMLVLNLKSQVDTRSSPWKAKVLKKLERMDLVKIGKRTAKRMSWRPLSQTEAYIRYNMDMNYRVVDYSVVLGTLDATIDSIARTGEGRVTAEVSEVVLENRLYPSLLPLLPSRVKKSFEAMKRELTFRRRSQGWALVK